MNNNKKELLLWRLLERMLCDYLIFISASSLGLSSYAGDGNKSYSPGTAHLGRFIRFFSSQLFISIFLTLFSSLYCNYFFETYYMIPPTKKVKDIIKRKKVHDEMCKKRGGTQEMNWDKWGICTWFLDVYTFSFKK